MLIEHRGKSPRIHESAYVAPNAVVCGDVTIGPGSRVLFGAVLTAESGAIEIGRHVIVMENALIRGREGHAVTIGDSSLPEGAMVPIGWIAVGDPAAVYPPERHDEIWPIQRELDWPGTVYGLQREAEGETMMPEAMRRYSELFGAHADDRVIE